MKKLHQRWIAIILTLFISTQSLWTLTEISYAAPSSSVSENQASNLVISQFFGGKKDDFLTLYANDFVEIYNPTDEAVSLANWSIQFADHGKSNWKKALLGTITTEIPAYGYYLIGLGSNDDVYGPNYNGAPNDKELPALDAYEPGFKLDNNLGKIVLLKSTSTLTKKNPLEDSLANEIIDFVGYDHKKPIDFYSGSSPAPQAGKQSTIARYVVDPLDSTKKASISSFSNHGNSWDTKDNGNDFEKLAGKPRNSSSSAAYAIVEEVQTINMISTTAIDSSSNTISLTAVNGTLKQGQWDEEDFAIFGLPEGLTATAQASEHEIIIEIDGNSTEAVTENHSLTFELQPSAWLQDNKPTTTTAVLQADDSVTLVKFIPSNQINGTVDATSLHAQVSSPTSLSAQFLVHLLAGIPVEGELNVNAYSIDGLPSGNWQTKAIGKESDNTISFSIIGEATSAIDENFLLEVILQPDAVQGNDWQASDSIKGVVIERYKTPVYTGAERKAFLIQSIQESNNYFNDVVNKTYKYSKEGMAKSASSLYRGAPFLIFEDQGNVISIPDQWKNYKNVNSWIEGDAHTSNVGYYDDKNGQIVFGLNDFDEGYIAPFYQDLLRLTSSMFLTRDFEGMSYISDSEMRDIAKNFLDEYMRALESLVGNDNKNTSITKLTSNNIQDGFTKTVMNKLSKKTQLDLLLKWTTPTKDGKHSTGVLNVDGKNDKYREATAAEKAEIIDHWSQYIDTLSEDFVKAKRSENPDYFKIKDIAVRMFQGLGSIGSQRYNVLIEGPSASHDDDIILDVKQESSPSILNNIKEIPVEPYDLYPGGEGARVRDASVNMTLDIDELTGYLNSDKRSFLVRKISTFKGDFGDATGGTFGNKNNYVDYLSYTAKAFAYAHARSISYNGTTFEESVMEQIYHNPVEWKSFQTTMVNLGEDYYQQVKSDYALIVKDMLDGKFIDISSITELTVSHAVLAPQFQENVTNYTSTVANAITSVDVTAMTRDSKATVNTNVGGLTKTFALKEGKNVISLDVMAQDGTTVTTYTITITRLAKDRNGNGQPYSEVTPPVVKPTEPTKPTQPDVTPPVVAPTKKFSDVPTSFWGYSAIDSLVAKGILQGTSRDSFEPNSQVTRAEFITMLVRGLGLKDKADLAFSDIKHGDWYADSIALAMQAGIVKGSGNNLFNPNANITREEMVTMLMRAYVFADGKLPAVTHKTFKDQEQVSQWAVAFVNEALELGLINGRSQGTFQPQGISSRAEGAQVIYNLLKLLGLLEQ